MYFSDSPFKVSLLAAAIALTGCGGDSSSSSDGTDEPKDGGEVGTPVSGFTISAKGGSSELGDGGEGGFVSITKYNSASALAVQKDGEITTAYSLPAQEVDLGSNPVTLTESETVHLVHNEDEDSRTLPAAGTLYMLDTDMSNAGPDGAALNVNRLYKSDGITALGSDETQVTGMVINEGAALILPNHRNGSDVRLFFRNDLQNNGLITTAKVPDSSTRIGLDLYPAAYYGAGSIDLSGDNAEYHGQRGGSLELFAHTISNEGSLNTRGATDGAEGNGGGQGGSIYLQANIFAENKGELNASGGSSSDYVGGQGGDINIGALEVYNTGAISSDSGDGRNGNNYSSSSVDISLEAARTLINTATISATGSTAHGNGNYNAGKGGDIELDLTPSYEIVGFEKTLINSGNLVVDGGSTTGEATGRAGYGGTIRIEAADDYLEDGNSPDEETASSQATFAVVSGTLSANGGSTLEADTGSSAYAGQGGQIYVTVYDQSPSTAGTSLLGYETIDVSGGTGLDGGNGGSISLLSGDYRDERGGSYVPALSGSLSNSVDLIVDGGSSNANVVEVGEDEENGYGRSAGSVRMTVENGYAYLQPGALTLSNTGAVSANGGRSFDNSYDSNAQGGSVSFVAPDAVTVTADVSANGGSDEHEANSGDTSYHIGSDAGNLMVVSQYGVATLDGTVSLNGGNGNLEGGDAGSLAIMAKEGSTAKGSYALNGGNALQSDEDAHNTEAGDAGQISVLSAAYNSVLEATVTATPGTGDEAGETNVIVVDADCESDNCNVESMMVGPR